MEETATIGAAESSPRNNGNDNEHDNDIEHEHGSSLPDAIFNFTNSIVGAGCIGLGGAIALSGGLISIVLVIFFAVLTKLSLDLLIRLSLSIRGTNTESAAGTASYEDLAHSGMGYWKGRVLVMVCKFSYSFGCLVAYIIVIKDNCGPALKTIGEVNDGGGGGGNGWFHRFLSNNATVTWAVSLAFILPLCMLRDMTPLAFGSLVSVASMVTIVGIVIYIYFACPDVRQEPTGGFYENWLEIRPGVLSNLGTFIFTFVSQHTVHLVFASLKPSLRTVQKWRIVSSLSLLAAATVSLLVGVFVYITFWQNTKSDIFQIYPRGWMIDTAKLLLCVTMVFTFPLPFFTCRELVILTVVHPLCGIDRNRSSSEHHGPQLSYRDEHEDDNDNVNDNDAANDATNDAENPEPNNETDPVADLRRPLLSDEPSDDDDDDDDANFFDTVGAPPLEGDASERDNTNTNTNTTPTTNTNTNTKWLLPDDDRQLRWSGHVVLTTQIWLVVTGLAIAAPSLGDILDLVGCASGTMIAFVIPGLLSFFIEGYTHLGMLIFAVGGLVGTVGTYYSIKQLIDDL
eukprot:jgi/Psemu1/257376/estExt_Genewise1Plus.C_2200017